MHLHEYQQHTFQEKQKPSPEQETFRVSQHFPFNAVIYEPLFTHGVKLGPRSLFAYLNFRAWQKKNLILRLAKPSFLVENTGLSRSSIKRHMAVLEELRLVKLVETNRSKGNRYLIEPLLLGQFCWSTLPLRHLEDSRLYQMVQSGPSEFREITSKIELMVQNEPSEGLKRTIRKQVARTELVQNGPQIYLLYSLLLCDATHCASTNESESLKKGGRLSAADIERRRQQELRKLQTLTESETRL